jgi:hypothetical protein
MISAGQLEALALAATTFGSPAMELTSRGNIQLRAITDTAAVAEMVAAAGLLPSQTHERVRNIVASPLSGRVGGTTDIRSEPALAELPGRFLFGVDDGRGDISGLGADVGAHFLDDDTAALLLAGKDAGVRLARAAVVPALIAIATRFVTTRGTSWRVAELADPAPLLEHLTPSAARGATWPPVVRPPVGWLPQDDGRVALGAAVPLGVLQARVAEYLAAIDAPLVITPFWSATSTRASPMHHCGCWHRWGWCSTSTRRGWRSARVRAAPAAHIRRPMFARMPLRRSTCRKMDTGTSSGANGRVAARLSVRCWWRPETDTSCVRPTRRFCRWLGGS